MSIIKDLENNAEKGDDLIDLKLNSRKEFDQIYNRYADTILQYIYTKTGNIEDSEDILQDVFIEFWDKRHTITSSVYGFLLSITKFKVFNYFRSARVKEKYILHLTNFLQAVNTNTPHKYLVAKEMLAQIESIITELPQQCKTVFYMSRFENKSNEEISNELNISLRTVENYLSKSLNFIKKNDFKLYLSLQLLLSYTSQ